MGISRQSVGSVLSPALLDELLSCLRGTSSAQGYGENIGHVTGVHKSWAPGEINFIYWYLAFSYFTAV